ncbi:MAG: TonB-dependent receptor [Hyphomonadaceae bacterium]|nr:TonB-dependent receptor [Hyphomonadaceae bacterium]
MPGVAFAQDSVEIDAEEALIIESVTVTAQRREQSLQDVPVTVTAFSSAAIERRRIFDTQSLIDSTPGISMDSFPKTAPRLTVRGIGSSNQAAGADPSSVTFLDGVYIGRGPMLSVDIFDVERVEVLKGPQGTLWGKNVVGGAIHYITQKPTDDFELKIRGTVAEYNQKDVSLVLNTPVSDNLATRFSFSSQKNDGYRTNLNTGGPLDDTERLTARFHALYDVNDNTSLLFSIDGTTDDSAGPARFNLAPNNFEEPDNLRVAAPDNAGFLKRDTWGTKLELNTSALGWADLTTYVSYRALDNSTFDDFDGATEAVNTANGVAVPAIHVLAEEEAESLSAELRLASTSEGPFSWVGGIFLLQDTVDRERESETLLIDTSENNYIAKNVTDSLGIFGDVRYQFSDQFGVFGGLRYTDESKESEIRREVGDPDNPTISWSTFGNPGTTDDKRWTWRLGADYRLNENLFVFGSVATGFKSGAFQERPDFELANIPTDPEEVTNYEVGIKSDFWQNRARANVSVFLADYTGLQTINTISDASLGPGETSVIVDNADAEIKGIETEFQLQATNNLRLDLLYTYLDAKFTDYVETQEILADGTPVVLDLTGNKLQLTPVHAATFSGVYTTDAYSWGELDFGLDLKYTSTIYEDNNNQEPDVRDPQTLVDAYISYRPKDNVVLQLWGKNLTDEAYSLHQVEILGGQFVAYAPGKQIGLSATVEF